MAAAPDHVALEQLGLRDRRRRHVIQLTARGRKTYRDARALAVKVGDEIFAPLDRTERAQLTDLLRRVMDPLWGKPK